MATLVCASILVEDPERALAEAREAKDGGADLVEFRIDGLFTGGGSAEQDLEYEIRRVEDLVRDAPLPCIITCRPVGEGGSYDGDESSRIALFERLGMATGEGAHPPRYLDVELATYTRSANIRQKINLAVDHPEQVRDVRTSLIVSLHDYDGRPPDLSRQLLKMHQERAPRVLKIAYRARSLRDNIDLFELLASRDRPTIALGMGEFGLMSRVLAGKFGGFLTFAGVRARGATAPGQPSLRELLDLYRFRSIGPPTRVYGVVGYPVAQSLSPSIHNAGFEALGHDGVYLPLPIVGDAGAGGGGFESLKATLAELVAFEPLRFAGASITHPHKENIVRLAREAGWQISDFARVCGAANTLVIQDEPAHARTVRVTNTDAPALLECLREALDDVAGRRILILGAGGLARSAALILSRSGARPIIAARRREQAEAAVLATRDAGVPAEAADWERRDSIPCDAIINCTPMGMAGTPDAAATPLSAKQCAQRSPDLLIVETVYSPALTPLLRAAREAGLRTIDGVAMFVRQAAAQFSMWTGRPAPIALFDRIVREQRAQ